MAISLGLRLRTVRLIDAWRALSGLFDAKVVLMMTLKPGALSSLRAYCDEASSLNLNAALMTAVWSRFCARLSPGELNDD